MTDTLFLLRLEHSNLSKLLGLIEAEVSAADAGGKMDPELLSLACEYFADYPDLCHHPKEDLVYRLLSERCPEACAGVRDLLADHRRLRELTGAFVAAVQRLREQPAGEEPQPVEVIREFTQHYRQHMRSEEQRFFPLAESRLSSSDWASLDFAVFDRDDPLFDHVAEERFGALRERIERVAEDGKARRAVFAAATELRQLSGVESFNASMQAGGWPERLTRFAQGGYALERQGQLVFCVPECSQERAAWCVYCYLLGASADAPVSSAGKRRSTQRVSRS